MSGAAASDRAGAKDRRGAGRMDSAHLVAPELVSGLLLLPEPDFEGDIALLRGTARAPSPPSGALASIDVRSHFVKGSEDRPAVRVLLYFPPEPRDRRLPVVLHMHGGGYVLGSPEVSDSLSRMTALEQNCLVASVDYRLAPESRFPDALEDGLLVLSWLCAQADDLGIDASRFVIAGESAGGGHAAALALHMRDLDLPRPRLVLLDAPMLDDRTGSSNPDHPYCGQFGWTAASNRFGWKALLGIEPGSDAVPEAAVPARATDLAGFPSTFVSVGTLDLFFEENLEFARRLVRQGIAVELHVVPGAYHGFGIAGPSPQLAMVLDLRRKALTRAFQG